MENKSAQMCHDLIMMLRQIKSGLLTVAEQYELTPVQLGGLYAIQQGHATMGQVAHTMHCDASNATGIVDRLVAQGLVERAESAADRRVKTLQLTAKGQKVMDAAVEKLPAVMGCSSLSDSEQRIFHTIINKLTAA